VNSTANMFAKHSAYDHPGTSKLIAQHREPESEKTSPAFGMKTLLTD
jgi:hypothetical protein